MKKIRILRNTGADLPPFTEGQEVDVHDKVAELLCRLKIAELLKAIPDNPLQAVPENPTIVAAEEKLAEIKNQWLGDAPQDPPKPKRHPKHKTKPKE